MADEKPLMEPPSLTPVSKPLSLIPVILKEAALDSPTFRATVLHFGEQIDLIERWLDNYVKAASKLTSEVSSLESAFNAFITQAVPPQALSEAALDHDYTILAIRRYNEGAREFWMNTIRGLKRIDGTVVEPIRAFLQTDIRGLRDARRNLEASQKTFDQLIARYAGRKKSEEPSSLREDAFQLHEARKHYLKACMDFCVMAPQIRSALDKLLVRVTTERWKDMKMSRDATDKLFSQHNSEMERIRGWTREMEHGDRVFKRELHIARKQLEESAEASARPSRELDDYSISTVPYIGSHSSAAPLSPVKPIPEKSEKHGWLFERSITGKPARTVWVRRWFFIKHGIFGWLIHGARSGAVEESEKVGVLLCGVRPAFQEERRFCFEVKTKDRTNILQADTQAELTDWIATFEVAKRKALEDPASTEATATTSTDAAFAISPPVHPEFAAKAYGHLSHDSDELGGLRQIDSLPLPGDRENVASRSSFDVSIGRRNVSGELERERESGRDHAARIIQKLDLHRKNAATPQLSATPSSPNPSTGGIASLISASHNMAVAPSNSQMLSMDTRAATWPATSLAPSTLANPPAPTNLSKAAVILSGDRGIGFGRPDGGLPSGILANLWGSTNWGYINRVERGEVSRLSQQRAISQPSSPILKALSNEGTAPTDPEKSGLTALPEVSPTPAAARHRKTMSLSGSQDFAKAEPPRPSSSGGEEYPPWYPMPLRAQDAQFHLLFPNVLREDKVVMVFRATWNPNEQQEFPGRVYVTTSHIYFYSNYLGLVLITGVDLDSIDEVTAAPGRDCDFLFVHFKEGSRRDEFTRVTVKVFLEPLKLLQRRLNFLVQNCVADESLASEELVKRLIMMEGTESESPEMDSWDNMSNIDTPLEAPTRREPNDLRSGLRIDGNLFASETTLARKPTRFKLPARPVVYRPQGMVQLAVEREFEISAKALFHLMFGDKSAVFQTLYRARWPNTIIQGPWIQQNGGGRHKREFEYRLDSNSAPIAKDCQVIEVLNDHLCYVIADKKTPWYLPLSRDFFLVTRIVITHVAKSRCRMGIYGKVDWLKQVKILPKIIERQALEDLDLEAQDLTDVIAGQVERLGSKSRTRKAVQIFGYVGQQAQTPRVVPQNLPPPSTAHPRVFKLVRRTLGSMLADVARAMAANYISTLIAWITALMTAMAKAFTAHTFLVGLLIASGTVNVIWSYRDTWSWWQNRRAASFMKRLGVGPDTVMSKAVYLRDVEDLWTNSTDAVFPDWSTAASGSSSSSSSDGSAQIPLFDSTANATDFAEPQGCHATFVTLLRNPDFPSSSAFAFPSAVADPVFAPGSGGPGIAPSARSTALRLRRSRQNLALYRHDLLVAMRLVNRVEREVLQAEWENWLLDENVRCRRVGEIIRRRMEGMGGGSESSGGGSGDNDTEKEASEGVRAVREWWEEYCGDCKERLQRLEAKGVRF
ncbi:hypothetical protein IWX49DRAFT_110209 [Phyllosticta citricarpa]|uniref:Transcription factor SipA3 n=1 Tax=Phyllosticta paracitricarpa TaxID=2016321 RepID=A0ABR1NK20_9PEZI